MFRAISALSLVAASLFTAQVASAGDWLMLGAYDFFPYSSTTKYDFLGGRGGYVSSGHSAVKAAVRIPIGKRFSSIYCQVLDVSAAKDISITLGELRSTDNNTSWGERTMATLSTAGAPGHVKIQTFAFNGSAVARTFECSDTCSYYTYYLTVSLPETSNTSIKSCAIEYV
jgi:hypothetical protein